MESIMEFTKAIVLTGMGADKVYLETKLKEPWPNRGNLYLRFDAPAGSGAEYVEETWPTLPMESRRVE